jgi:twitching motility protein PilU
MYEQPTAAAGPDVYPLLQALYEHGGSDMFFSVGSPAQVKVEGHTLPLDTPPLEPGAVRHMAYQLMSAKQIAEFELELEMNLAVSVENGGRFRINVYYQRGEVSMVARLIKHEVPSIGALGLPPQLEQLALLDRGLILVIGAAGAGKSTTLAAMLEYRNQHRDGHILCIEDPIEFIHQHQRSIIEQREVGLDTHSFAAALRNVLREAPDVIMLGEIRDLDGMQHALHYAETGHLCIATLHATSTTHALERVVRFFPEEARQQVLADLGQNLAALIGQRLVLVVAQKRVAAVELLLTSAHISDLIQRGLFDELREAISQGTEQGLQTFDQHLLSLFQSGRISLEEAIHHAQSRTDLALKVRLAQASHGIDPQLNMLRDS